MSQFTQATVTNHQRWDSLNSKHLFLIVLDIGNKIKMGKAQLLDVQGPLSGLQIAFFSLSPHMAESKEKQGLLCVFL